MNDDNRDIGKNDALEASSHLVCVYSFDLIFLHVTVNSVLLLQRQTSLIQARNKTEEAFGRVNTLWLVCRFAEERIYRTLVLVGFLGAVGSIEGDRVLWLDSWLALFSTSTMFGIFSS